MIKKRNGKYVLYTKDGKRVLGTHNTAREAYAQEYAIEKSMEKKSMLGPEGTILGAAIGRSLGSTDEEKARAAAFGGAVAMGAGYATLPYVFTPAIKRLLTERDLAEFNRKLQQPGLVSKAKTYGEAAGKIFNPANILKLKSPFSYVQQHKSGLDVLKGIASIYPRGLAVAGTAGLLGGLLGKYTADREKTSSIDLLTGPMGAGKSTLLNSIRDQYDLVEGTDLGSVVDGEFVEPKDEDKPRLRQEKADKILKAHSEGKRVLMEGYPPGMFRIPGVVDAADRAVILEPDIAQRLYQIAKRSGERGTSAVEDVRYATSPEHVAKETKYLQMLRDAIANTYTADTSDAARSHLLNKTSSARRHRATLLIRDPQTGNILARPDGRENKYGPYQFPGGGVHEKEVASPDMPTRDQILEGAQREALEELGFGLKNPRLLYDYGEELDADAQARLLAYRGVPYTGGHEHYVLAEKGEVDPSLYNVEGDAFTSGSYVDPEAMRTALLAFDKENPGKPQFNTARAEALRRAILEKTSSDQQDVYVQSAVPTKYLELMKRKGLASQKAIAEDPELLKAFLDVRNLSEEKFRADLAERLDHWQSDSVSGPSVFFTSPDPDKVSDPRHFINQYETSPVKINLSRLIRDMPDTRIAGSELVPYDPDGPEHQGDIRHRDITLEQAAEYARTDPKELWKNYKPEYVGKYYAADVPHAQIVTPSGVIPPEYLEVEKTSEEVPDLNKWIKSIEEEARRRGVRDMHVVMSHPKHPLGGGSAHYTTDLDKDSGSALLIKALRNKMREWEKSQGLDPDHDWSKTSSPRGFLTSTAQTVPEFKDENYAHLVPPKPKRKRKDLEEAVLRVKDEIASASPEDMEYSKLVASGLPMEEIIARELIDPYTSRDNWNLTPEEYTQFRNSVIRDKKKLYPVARPFALAERYGIDLGLPEEMAQEKSRSAAAFRNFSYPSFHTARGAFLAETARDLVPEDKQHLVDELISRIGRARIQQGVHSHQDVEAGEELGREAAKIYKEKGIKTSSAKEHLKHILITGQSGSGKTTEAKRLAGELGMPVLHLDEQKGFGAKGIDPDYIEDLTQATQDIIGNLDKPHVVEGTQLLSEQFPLDLLRSNDLRILEAGEDELVRRLTNRGWNTESGRDLKGPEHADEARHVVRHQRKSVDSLVERLKKKASLDSDFTPDFSPDQLKSLGVYDQVYGDTPSEASMKEWPESWINEQDPLGWLQWYERYSKGRRTDDDARQIKRWKSFKARHLAQYLKNPTKRRAAALRNWGVDVSKLPDAVGTNKEASSPILELSQAIQEYETPSTAMGHKVANFSRAARMGRRAYRARRLSNLNRGSNTLRRGSNTPRSRMGVHRRARTRGPNPVGRSGGPQQQQQRSARPLQHLESKPDTPSALDTDQSTLRRQYAKSVGISAGSVQARTQAGDALAAKAIDSAKKDLENLDEGVSGFLLSGVAALDRRVREALRDPAKLRALMGEYPRTIDVIRRGGGIRAIQGAARGVVDTAKEQLPLRGAYSAGRNTQEAVELAGSASDRVSEAVGGLRRAGQATRGVSDAIDSTVGTARSLGVDRYLPVDKMDRASMLARRSSQAAEGAARSVENAAPAVIGGVQDRARRLLDLEQRALAPFRSHPRYEELSRGVRELTRLAEAGEVAAAQKLAQNLQKIVGAESITTSQYLGAVLGDLTQNATGSGLMGDAVQGGVRFTGDTALPFIGDSIQASVGGGYFGSAGGLFKNFVTNPILHTAYSYAMPGYGSAASLYRSGGLGRIGAEVFEELQRLVSSGVPVNDAIKQVERLPAYRTLDRYIAENSRRFRDYLPGMSPLSPVSVRRQFLSGLPSAIGRSRPLNAIGNPGLGAVGEAEQQILRLQRSARDAATAAGIPSFTPFTTTRGIRGPVPHLTHGEMRSGAGFTYGRLMDALGGEAVAVNAPQRVYSPRGAMSYRPRANASNIRAAREKLEALGTGDAANRKLRVGEAAPILEDFGLLTRGYSSGLSEEALRAPFMRVAEPTRADIRAVGELREKLTNLERQGGRGLSTLLPPQLRTTTKTSGYRAGLPRVSTTQLAEAIKTAKEKGTATKRDPKKWAAAKARAKAKMGGKWSARAAQLAVKYYKDSGGRYKGKKPTAKNNKLKKWTKQDWQWSGDVKKEQKKKKSREKKSELLAAILEKEAGKGVYLPRRATIALNSTKGGRKKLKKAEDNKRRHTNKDKQYSTHGLHRGKKRSKLGSAVHKLAYDVSAYRPRGTLMLTDGKGNVFAGKTDMNTPGAEATSPYYFPGGGILKEEGANRLPTPKEIEEGIRTEALEELGLDLKDLKVLNTEGLRMDMPEWWRERQRKKRGVEYKGLSEYYASAREAGRNRALYNVEGDAFDGDYYPIEEVATALEGRAGKEDDPYGEANREQARILRSLLEKQSVAKAMSKEKSALRDLIRGRKLDTDAEPALDVVKMSYFDDVADPDNVRPIDRQERLRGFSQTASDPQYMRPRTPKTNESVEDASTNLYNRIGNQDYNQFGEKAVSRLGNLGAYR